MPISLAWPAPLMIDQGENPAGTGTVIDASPQAFGFPLNGVTSEQRRQFTVGNAFFRDAWVSAPSSTVGRDGLGPIFNAASCGACHNQDGRGIGYRNGKVDASLLFRLSRKNPDSTFGPNPLYGDQLNPSGILSVPGEGQATVRFEITKAQYPDGERYELSQPIFDFSQLTYGALSADDVVSARVAPQMIGLGLIENIPQSEILKGVDRTDSDGDGISGRANWIQNVETKNLELGRFGWKANQPSIRQQVAGAFSGDMGLTSSVFANANCQPNETECLNAPNGGTPEVLDLILDRVVTYSSLLAVPQRRAPNDPQVVLGQRLFAQVKCTSCHRPNYNTGSESRFDVLNNQSIWPYSDFLLHDMGDRMADHRPDNLADGNEWRTPPLWGIGLFASVSGHTNLLHDGRARGVEEAILWHDGEARLAKSAFVNLNKNERSALIRFVLDL